MLNYQIKQLLAVQNPLDGKIYNLMPLFTMLEEWDESFISLSEYIEKAGEMILYLLEHDDWLPLDVKNASSACVSVKNAFRQMKAIET